MTAFRNHELDLLVSTTVIEVGVDVPNATILLIENAERFGLSQLHQLRGRVGRGSAQSYCILMTDHVTEDCRTRMQIMSRTNDGFQIAEADLQLRGPGDFFGQRQHGLPPLQIADLSHDRRSGRERIAGSFQLCRVHTGRGVLCLSGGTAPRQNEAGREGQRDDGVSEP